MATYVEINNNKYPAIITGRLTDNDWDNRSSKSIKLEMPYSQVAEIFIDDISWNIVQDVEREIETIDENGESIIEKTIEFDLSQISDMSIYGRKTLVFTEGKCKNIVKKY